MLYATEAATAAITILFDCSGNLNDQNILNVREI